MKTIRKYFLTGILIVSPVLVTIIVFLWLFRFLDGILGRFINKYLIAHYGRGIPGLGIILAVLVTFFVGFLVTHLINKKVLSIVEKWFVKFPIIKQIYPAVKQIIYFLFSKDGKAAFKNTVLVEYPRKGIWTLGFITNEGSKHFNEKTGKELVNVFLPTTPGPLTGYLAFVPKEEVIIVDISIEDALKIIISGGVVNPK